VIGFEPTTSASRTRRRHGALRLTTSRDELLAGPDVTVVYAATEHHRHFDDVLAAAEAGKHVLCDKPLANTVADCRRMIDACNAHDVSLQIAYYRRYYPKMIRTRELFASEDTGEPVTVHIHCTQRLEPARITADNWRLRREVSGGGALVDTGSHRLDLRCWLLGEPQVAAALAERQELPVEATDVESLLIGMANCVHVTSVHGYRSSSEDRFDIVGMGGSFR